MNILINEFLGRLLGTEDLSRCGEIPPISWRILRQLEFTSTKLFLWSYLIFPNVFLEVLCECDFSNEQRIVQYFR